jgi:hypothetical protein
MTEMSIPSETSSASRATQLNRACTCVTLDREALKQALVVQAGDGGFIERLFGTHPHSFSNVPVFLSVSELAEMEETVAAVEAVSRLSQYQAQVLSWAPEIALQDFGPAGALMGYDFHLAPEGPCLIEVNTNAGGAFLNAVLSRAQRACCGDSIAFPPGSQGPTFEDSAFQMFQEEWLRQRGNGVPESIAIVDDCPEQQFLFPEFVLAHQVLRQRGIYATISDASQLHYDGSSLSFEGERIDLVYNRVTDFALARPEHTALGAAYRAGAVVLTPNPHNHALMADKRNLSVLSDPSLLQSWGVTARDLAALRSVPPTVTVTPENAPDLWQSRKALFFKPSGGHGSKAVYRGDKLTKRVWAEISRGGYVAQSLVRPSERMVMVDGSPQSRKVDVRLYTYQGRALLGAARVYQGQTTNLQTPGGGFAPLFVV